MFFTFGGKTPPSSFVSCPFDHPVFAGVIPKLQVSLTGLRVVANKVRKYMEQVLGSPVSFSFFYLNTASSEGKYVCGLGSLIGRVITWPHVAVWPR